MSQPTFNITVVSWGYANSISIMTVRVGKDPRLAVFRGDAYWQWDATCLRNYEKNCSWTQALHDALEGWHACILHTGDMAVILPKHPDYERVRQLVEDVDNGCKVPTSLEKRPL